MSRNGPSLKGYDFWRKLEIFNGISCEIKLEIKNVLQKCGYDNSLSFSYLSEERLMESQEYYNKVTRDKYYFLPGDKDFVLTLSKVVKANSEYFELPI